MTVEQVRKQVEFIKSVAEDDEAAHSYEDELHQQVIQAIAAGKCENPRELALEALATRNIKFARWCA